MGLDTTHNCWHGAYSSFNRFRYWLAEKIGVDLNEYIGYSENGTKYLSSIDHDIMPLLNHSDCEGILTVQECILVSSGIEKILSSISEEEKKDEEHPFSYLNNAIQFKEGLDLAISRGEAVEFR